MKTQILAAAFMVATLISCKKAEKLEPANVPDITKPETILEGKQCFEWVQGKDTISMSLAMSGNNATGELAYKFFEKDKNSGTFSGVFIGDTLVADYTFQSEGVQSIREAVFLRQDNLMIQARGETVMKDNKEVFKDFKKLTFDSNLELAKTDCK